MSKWMMKKWIRKPDWLLSKLHGFLSSTVCLPPRLMLFSSFATKSRVSTISASRTENYFSDLHVWSFSPWGYHTGFTTFSNSCACNLAFLSSRTLPNSMKLTFCNGTVLHRNQVRSTFGDWLNGITELSKSLQAIDIDASAYACLSALTLVNGE